MRKPLPPEYLYLTRKASVSPSWVRLGKTSYTVHSILKLEYRKLRMPRAAKYALFFVSLVLLYFSAVHLMMKSLPLPIALPAFIGSAVLFAVASWLAFVKPPQYCVTISLLDGSQAFIRLRKEEDAQNLHDAITRAMDWHRGNSGGHAELISSAIARRVPRSA
ncbi:MAG: DUF6232 family protein [Granulosicoccus sp.]